MKNRYIKIFIVGLIVAFAVTLVTKPVNDDVIELFEQVKAYNEEEYLAMQAVKSVEEDKVEIIE